MQLFEVKNDIAKIIYNPAENHLLPSDFLLVEDVNQKLISQIINIETTENSNNNLAVLRLCLAIDKEDNLSYYNGYIPSKTSKIIYINPDEIMELIKGTESSIYFGCLSNHADCYVKPSMKFLNDKMYILSDRDDKTHKVVNNLIIELQNKSKKVVLLDFDGQYTNIENANVVKISEGFKLPLNIDAFSTILEHDTVDCPLEDKAVIQSIVLELREYLKTLPDKYLPFTMFKNVVDDEFLSNPVSGLMLLRNKLWLYAQDSIFAENKSQFDVFDSLLDEKHTLVIDATSIDEKWYKFVIQTVQALCNKSCYFILSLNDVKIDKKSIISLYNKQSVIPIVSTSYTNECVQILKSICKNFVLFKPSSSNNFEDSYSVLLNKINADEFLLYGDATLYLPLLLELVSFAPSVAEDIIENEIKREVDKFFSSQKTVIPQEPVLQLEDNVPVQTIVQDEQSEPQVPTQIEVVEQTQASSSVLIPDFDILDDMEFSEVGMKPDEIVDDLNDNDLDFLDETLSKDFEEYTPVVTPKDVLDEKKYDMFDPLSDELDDVVQCSSSSNPDGLSVVSVDEQDDVIELIDENGFLQDDLELEPLMPETVPMSVLLSDSYSNKQNNSESKKVNEEEQDEFEVIEFSVLDEFSDFEQTNEEVNTVENNQNNEVQEAPLDVKNVLETENIDILDDEAVSEKSKLDEEITPLDDIISNITSKYVDSSLPEQETILQEDNAVQEEVSDVLPEKKQRSKDEIEIDLEGENDIASRLNIKPPKIKEKINNTKKPKDVPVYETDAQSENFEDGLPYKKGDLVYHPKYGKGVIEGFANYSNKIFFCQIDFENVGRRILDPRSSGIEKI